jgi:hypothetical protein
MNESACEMKTDMNYSSVTNSSNVKNLFIYIILSDLRIST